MEPIYRIIAVLNDISCLSCLPLVQQMAKVIMQTLRVRTAVLILLSSSHRKLSHHPWPLATPSISINPDKQLSNPPSYDFENSGGHPKIMIYHDTPNDHSLDTPQKTNPKMLRVKRSSRVSSTLVSSPQLPSVRQGTLWLGRLNPESARCHRCHPGCRHSDSCHLGRQSPLDPKILTKTQDFEYLLYKDLIYIWIYPKLFLFKCGCWCF